MVTVLVPVEVDSTRSVLPWRKTTFRNPTGDVSGRRVDTCPQTGGAAVGSRRTVCQIYTQGPSRSVPCTRGVEKSLEIDPLMNGQPM